MKQPLDRLSLEILDLIYDYKTTTYRQVTESLIQFSRSYPSYNSFKLAIGRKIGELMDEGLVEDYRSRIVLSEHGLRWYTYIYEPALAKLRERGNRRRKRGMVVVA